MVPRRQPTRPLSDRGRNDGRRADSRGRGGGHPENTTSRPSGGTLAVNHLRVCAAQRPVGGPDRTQSPQRRRCARWCWWVELEGVRGRGAVSRWYGRLLEVLGRNRVCRLIAPPTHTCLIPVLRLKVKPDPELTALQFQSRERDELPVLRQSVIVLATKRDEMPCSRMYTQQRKCRKQPCGLRSGWRRPAAARGGSTDCDSFI